MPELPEVETIKRDLVKKILGGKITKVEIKDKKAVKSDLKELKSLLKGNCFSDISRIGKLLIFKVCEKNYFMLVHLKMTGQLVYTFKKFSVAGGHSFGAQSDTASIGDKLPSRHTRVIFEFKNGARLFFNDMRRFGYIKVVDSQELKNIKGEYGLEPLKNNFTFKNLKNVFKGRKTSVKAVLLNQKLISGVGNIYADEILFRAGVRPDKIVGVLRPIEIKKLYRASNYIIKKAIKYRGTTFSDYMDIKGRKGNFSNLLKVYGRSGEKCYRCSSIVKKIRIAGRGTHVCFGCQK